MILVVLSPVIWLVVAYAPRIGALIFASIWILDPVQIEFINLSYTAILFFFLGGCLAIRDYDLNWVDRHGVKLTIIYFAVSMIAAYLITSGILPSVLTIYFTFIPGIICTWYLAGRAASKSEIAKYLAWLSPFAFFVYAAHEPTLTFLRKIAFKLLNPSNASMILILYIVIPLIDVAIVLFAAYLLKRTLPHFYSFITGSR